VVVIAEEYLAHFEPCHEHQTLINHVGWVGASQIITHASFREILYKGIRFFKILGDTAAEQALKVFEITAKGVKVTYEMLQLALDQYSLAVAK